MQAKRLHVDSDSDEEEGSVFSAPADARSQSTGTELSVWTPPDEDANNFAVDQDFSLRLREELELLDALKAAEYDEKEKAGEDLGPRPPYYHIATFNPESA